MKTIKCNGRFWLTVADLAAIFDRSPQPGHCAGTDAKRALREGDLSYKCRTGKKKGPNQESKSLFMFNVFGAPGWDRTSNPCLRRAVLYPLSYGRGADDSISAPRAITAGRRAVAGAGPIISRFCAGPSGLGARRPARVPILRS